MTTKRLLSTAMIVLALLVFTSSASAQRVDDRDGDGVPDNVDNCPAQAGPRENGGCPLPDTSPNPNTGSDTPDRDADGVPDFVDLCPDQAGTGFTEGCPDDAVNPNPNPTPAGQPNSPPQVLFTWGSMSQCMVGLLPTAPTTVNIREQATTSATIIGQLLPGQQFAPFFANHDENGGLWFAGAPAGDNWGWVFGGVVANNGHCDSLPMVIPLGTSLQFDFQLTLDPDLLPDSVPYLEVKLQKVIVVHMDPTTGVPAPGGVEHTDDWDEPAFLALELLNEEGNPPSDYQNTFQAIPDSVNSAGFQPLLLVKPLDPDAPEDCADIGEGVCLVAGLLLPALGDAPGQCPPEPFVNGLQAVFPNAAGDGSVDGRDFLVWQRNLGTDDISDYGLLLPASDPEAAGIPKLSEYAINGNALGLLLPAVQAIRAAAAHSSSGEGQHEIEYQIEAGESCALVGFVPGGESTVMGDGSVMPSFGTFVLLLPAVQ